MTKMEKIELTRRSVVQGAGMFVFSIGVPVGLDTMLNINAALAQGARPALVPTELDSYLAVNADGSVTVYFGKIDGGQGIDVAIAQIVAEELDVPVKSVKVIMGDTARTLNQGGASGSNGVHLGGMQMRRVAAEARRVLVEAAAKKLNVPADKLVVDNGVITVTGDATKKTSYTDLIGGQFFNVKLEWNGKIGNELETKVAAKPKSPDQYKIVGKSIPRSDIPDKLFGKYEYVTDVKVPGMVHGRMIRPPVAGAIPEKIDESSIKDIPGARVVQINSFLGVVADKEWDAIQASQNLKVQWSNPKPAFPEPATIYDFIRNAKPRKSEVPTNTGNVEEAFKNAAKVIEAEYEWPYQSHASMGPACAVVDASKEGEATVWTGSQKPHYVRDGVAAILKLPEDKVHGIWAMGPGSYGRNDAGDAAMDAALLSKAVGKPVRVQWMRNEGHGWDPKGPASIHRVRAALDASGKVIAYDYYSKGFSRVDVNSNESKPRDTLAGQLIGVELKSGDNFGIPGENYVFENKRVAWDTIAPPLDRASPLRTSHLRDPVGPQITFASESFIDELAAATNSDPIEFRLRYLKNERDIAVIKAAAERAKWETRASPRKEQSGDKLLGRGFSYATRSGTRVAIIAEIEVDKRTGKVWARKYTVAHDCGQIINPGTLNHVIEGNIVQSTSRALWEEVHFDPKTVTSVDWLTYPILDMSEAPETVDIVLIDRPTVNPSGAGEGSTRPTAAALANAIFDATGVRIRRVPLTPERVKAALA
jgi:CO/xanthine dehydrogenase Mo-binding subunit